MKEFVAAEGALSKHSIWYSLNPLRATEHRRMERDLGLLMILEGIDISVRNDACMSSPAVAAAGDRADDNSLVAALLATGASMSPDNDGNTPVHYIHHPGILKILLRCGATVTSRNNLGRTSLIAVAENNQ